MRTSCYFFCLLVNIFFISTTTFAQTVNFDATWKEFLDNDKISNMSELVKPDKVYDKPEYAKYLLMNTNSCFCQSKIGDAETLMAEIEGMDAGIHKSIPGFLAKKDNLETKIKAYHSMDAIWKQFLKTKEVSQEELEAVAGANTSCEKRTLAKYSYMTAYQHFCEGNISKSKDVFENRTLKLTEKTTLRVQDIEGLAAEVAKMKSMFKDMAKLDVAWKAYMKNGVSPGFDTELPLFRCNPVPNMKALVLQGALNICDSAPVTLEKIKKLEAESSVALNGELQDKIKDLEKAIQQNEDNLAVLNEAWEAFIPNNKVRHVGKYGHEFCTKEPLIRAYIMDGFAYPCEMAEEVLQKIDALQKKEITPLEQITMIKINELADLSDKYQSDGGKLEKYWNKFVAQGDKLPKDYQSAGAYCDNIHQVKDWTMQGLSGSCEESPQYLSKIDAFQETFDFKFTKELECRVQKLRAKVWDCRHEALTKLARIEAPDAYQERLKELMVEYGMEAERPEVCSDK